MVWTALGVLRIRLYEHGWFGALGVLLAVLTSPGSSKGGGLKFTALPVPACTLLLYPWGVSVCLVVGKPAIQQISLLDFTGEGGFICKQNWFNLFTFTLSYLYSYAPGCFHTLLSVLICSCMQASCPGFCSVAWRTKDASDQDFLTSDGFHSVWQSYCFGYAFSYLLGAGNVWFLCSLPAVWIVGIYSLNLVSRFGCLGFWWPVNLVDISVRHSRKTPSWCLFFPFFPHQMLNFILHTW